MPYRINGCGTTIHPMPDEDQQALVMHWFTLLYIPIIPLGWQLVLGGSERKYYKLKALSWGEAKKILPLESLLKLLFDALMHGLFIWGLLLIVSLIVSGVVTLLR